MQLGTTFAQIEDAMRVAIDLAREGVASGEAGIGALVLSPDNECVAARHDEVRSGNDPTRHAAVLALRDAARAAKSWRLLGYQLVVTREPCALCAGAALSSRVGRVVVAELDPQLGCLGSRYHFGTDPRLNHEFAVTYGVLADEAASVYSETRSG
jgi:tRNA(adenine34) deaminase